MHPRTLLVSFVLSTTACVPTIGNIAEHGNDGVDESGDPGSLGDAASTTPADGAAPRERDAAAYAVDGSAGADASDEDAGTLEAPDADPPPPPPATHWTLRVGTLTTFASPFGSAEGTFSVRDLPSDVTLRAAWSNGFVLQSTSCHPEQTTIVVSLDTGAEVLEERVTLALDAGSAAGDLVADLCTSPAGTSGSIIAALDGTHAFNLSTSCELRQFDLDTMQFDASAVPTADPGDHCWGFERARDGRLYTRIVPGNAPSGPAYRARLHESGSIDLTFTPRPETHTFSEIDANGHELVYDRRGTTLTRLDDAGNIDSSFAPPTFGRLSKVFPLTHGIVVFDEEYDYGDYDLYMTKLDDTGALIAPRQFVFAGEGPQVTWGYELPGGDLLFWYTRFAADSGQDAFLYRMHGASTAQLYRGQDATPPVFDANGTLRLVGTTWRYHQVLLELTQQGTVREQPFYLSNDDEDCPSFGYNPLARPDGTLAILGVNACGGTSMLGAVRLR